MNTHEFNALVETEKNLKASTGKHGIGTRLREAKEKADGKAAPVAGLAWTCCPYCDPQEELVRRDDAHIYCLRCGFTAESAPVAEPNRETWRVLRGGNFTDIVTCGYPARKICTISRQAWEKLNPTEKGSAELIAATPETTRQRDELEHNLRHQCKLNGQASMQIEELETQREELCRSHDQLLKVAQRFEAHLRNRIADGPPMTDEESLSALSDVMGALSRGAKLEGSL